MNSETSFAFDDFSNYDGYLKGFAFKLTKDWHLAEDLFQETAFLAFKNQNKFSAGTNLKAWLTTIMRNTFISQWQRRKRSVSTAENGWLEDLEERTVLNEAETNLATAEILEIIQQLPAIYRDPFLLHAAGYKYKEIATNLGTAVGTIKSRIFVARKTLREGGELRQVRKMLTAVREN